MFDSQAFSNGVSLTIVYVWPLLSCFHRGKCRLLHLYIHIALIDPIYTFSLQPGNGGNHFRTFCATVVAVGRSTTLIHSTSNVEQTPSSVARLKLDGASGCGVTCYREELRIFVKL